jgi:hypothetical protein
VHIATAAAINAEQIKKVATGVALLSNPGNRLNAFSTAFMGIAP